MDTPGIDPFELVDRLFPAPLLPPPRPGDRCTLEGDPRPHKVVAVDDDAVTVYLVGMPSVTYRRIPLDQCIPYPDAEAG